MFIDKAQTVIEYATLIAVVAAAVMAMTLYVRRSVEGNIKAVSDTATLTAVDNSTDDTLYDVNGTDDSESGDCPTRPEEKAVLKLECQNLFQTLHIAQSRYCNKQEHKTEACCKCKWRNY